MNIADDNQSPADDRHVVLVGLMGSGKSSVGRKLAQLLARPFVDTDRLVEGQARATVREIFDSQGEAEFRRLESTALSSALSSTSPSVIAAAGGVVLSDVNRNLLTSDAHSIRLVVVWLDTSTSELAQRVKRGTHRPLLDRDPIGTLDQMAQERRDLYAEVADVVVETNGRSGDEVVHEVMRVLGMRGVHHG